jgi:hypothetical protein
VVLGQLEQFAGGGLAGRGGASDRFDELRMGARVQAEGGLVTGHRFEVIDDAVLRPARRQCLRAVVLFSEDGAGAELLQLRFNGGSRIVVDDAVEIEGLDERVALQQRGSVIVELLARDLPHAGEQLVGDVGHLDRFVQSFAHCRDALPGALFERECLVVVLQVVRREEQGGRRRQAGGQCQGRCKREL